MKKDNNNAALKWIYKRAKKSLPAVIVISILSAISSASAVGIALLTKKVLDIATKQDGGNFIIYGIGIFGIVLLQVAIGAFNSWLETYSSVKLTISIREYLFSMICKKKYNEISNYHSGDLLNRFTSDVDVIIGGVYKVIPNVVAMVTKIVAGMSAMIMMEPKVAIIVLIIGFAIPAIGKALNRRYKYIHKECQKTEGVSRSFMQECFENIVVIKSFVSEKPFVKKLDKYFKENFKLQLKRICLSIFAHLGLHSFFTIGYYTILLWGASGLAVGSMTYGTLTAFLQLVSQISGPLQNASSVMPHYYAAMASAERILNLEEHTDEAVSLSESELNKCRQNFRTIEVNNVCFKYDNEEILKDCSFSVESGKITAITGESGSGKSTLFKIMLGLYEPQKGSISLNGETPVDASVRGIFAYVPQGNMVLSGSIRENITLCNPEIDEEKLIEVTKAAEIYDFINTLPDGFDTELNERGAGLSEGQLQRISIARALLTDAPILLLDEATSALDEETETRVLANIKNLTGKTVLFITHRNTSLKVCDSIVHVNNKKFEVIK